jgi:hypothetical protein
LPVRSNRGSAPFSGTYSTSLSTLGALKVTITVNVHSNYSSRHAQAGTRFQRNNMTSTFARVVVYVCKQFVYLSAVWMTGGSSPLTQGTNASHFRISNTPDNRRETGDMQPCRIPLATISVPCKCFYVLLILLRLRLWSAKRLLAL